MATTFVLGAGFSVEEQFPLVRGLKERVIHFLEAEQHSSYQTFLRPPESWPEFSKGLFYVGLEEVDPHDTLGFEELLIELGKRRHEGQASITDHTLRIGVSRLLWCISFFIWRVDGCYENFARRIAATSGNSAVISFNWDLLIERALTEIGQPWSYSATNAGDSIPVIKPHGSINWSSYAQNPNLTAEYDAWRPIAPGSTLSYDIRQPLANPDLQEINSDLRYCIFPGDPDLPGSHPDLAKLWEEVAQIINRSDKIVFIGYSLPVYDQFAREHLSTLCSSRMVEVVDPSDESLQAFKQLVPQAITIRKTFAQCEYAQPTKAG
jgi:hypothetical protein